MTFDRVKWMDAACQSARYVVETAEFKNRVTILALLADDDGRVPVPEFEHALGLAPGTLHRLLGDVVVLGMPPASP